MNNEFEKRLKDLKKGYLMKLRENFSSFKNLINENPLNIQEIYSRVHTISGTSGLYSLSNLSEISTVFELYLKPFKENIETLKEDEIKNKLLEYINYLEKAIKGD